MCFTVIMRVLPFLGNEHHLEALREIFFRSSARQTFSSAEERASFFENWTGYYFANEPTAIYLAVDSQNHLMGYLTGCTDSAVALPFFTSKIPSYSLFADQFDRFPAHLHVNCHPDAR